MTFDKIQPLLLLTLTLALPQTTQDSSLNQINYNSKLQTLAKYLVTGQSI